MKYILKYLKSAKEMPVYLNCAKKERKSLYCDMHLDFQYKWFKCTRNKMVDISHSHGSNLVRHLVRHPYSSLACIVLPFLGGSILFTPVFSCCVA